MVKVITYGTYDLLHYGHIKLLERAKALGDYLIVGVTADDYDKTRGKINVQQSLVERIDAVKATGLADEIIVEEYEGQKIDDIKKYGIDIFTVGSDWKGQFDYLKEYCQVIYLPRTAGISSSNIRSDERNTKLLITGDKFICDKFHKESSFVNGISSDIIESKDFKEKLDQYDACFIVSNPKKHYDQIKYALEHNKHVLCESPIALSIKEADELEQLAQDKGLILMESIKTAYSTAYNRMILQAKSGKIGDIVSVDAVCTSMREFIQGNLSLDSSWNSICAWGPTALLPIFQLFGTDYKKVNIISKRLDTDSKFDGFTKIDFLFKNGVASAKVAKSAKSEGELVISGTKGYIYVPAPWWKTDYYEIRFENPENNIRQFYQLDGEGIRQELVTFLSAIQKKKDTSYINKNITKAISGVMEKYYQDDIEEI